MWDPEPIARVPRISSSLPSSFGLVLALLLAAPAFAQGPATPRYRVQIEAPDELRDLLRGGLSLLRWQDDAEMTLPLLERLVADAARDIKGAASARGWFSAKVDTQIDQAATPWTVTLRVDPGARTQVTAIDITFQGPAVDDTEARDVLQEVRKTWSLRTGAPFRQGDWDSAKETAVRTLSSWRYAAARIVDSEARIDPQAHTATLSVTLDSGPPFRFGPIVVKGVERYAERLVRNLSPIEAGETFDRKQLDAYQRRLLETGFFASAYVDADAEAAVAGATPVRVAVIEGPSQHLELGVDLTTDLGLTARGSYDDLDLFGRAWRLRTELQTGVALQRAQVGVDLPPRADARWINLFSRLERSDVQNQQSTEFAVGAALNEGMVRSPSGPAVSLHVEQLRRAGLPIDYRRAVFFEYRRAFDVTDDPVTPREGWLGAASVGVAPGALATRRFGRVEAHATYLRPLSRNVAVHVRGEVGAVLAQERSGIPSSFLFRTGGDLSVRGYEFDSLGVREGDAVVGGRYLAVGSVELIRWIGENWGPAVFVDVGDAWDNDRGFNAAVGYGAGVRFFTPVGPIRADIAYGERTRKFRLHFSIGYRF